jgi:hypothetical protein
MYQSLKVHLLLPFSAGKEQAMKVANDSVEQLAGSHRERQASKQSIARVAYLLIAGWVAILLVVGGTRLNESRRVADLRQPVVHQPPNAEDEYQRVIRPILQEYCWTCHSTDSLEGELDLERFIDIGSLKQETDVWEMVLEQLSTDQMPPQDAAQLSAEHKAKLVGWIREMLDEVARENAGDPGAVILRRLSNREYTYSIRDLTGVNSLDPTHEFPIDGAAGEGFTNTGAALVMSPALLQKYLEAAKVVARHAVLLPDGIRFSASDSPQDWTEESLSRIREFYNRFTTTGEAANTVQQGVELDVGLGRARLPLSRYLDALQGRASKDGLSTKYLDRLHRVLKDGSPTDESSAILGPLREHFRNRQLTRESIEAWQRVLWKFSNIGHIGRANGPRAWQEPVSPLVSQQELRYTFTEERDQTLYFVSGSAGDGDQGDAVVWENPRIIVAGQADLPIASLPELLRHLELDRRKIIDNAEACLGQIAAGNRAADPELLNRWRDYLGLGETQLDSLMSERLERTTDYAFIQGWTGVNALSVIANSSDMAVRIPGLMKPHSVAMHPAPDRAAVVAWKSPATGAITINGTIQHAHPECGNGVQYSLEVRRGKVAEQLAQGVSQGANSISLGPFSEVQIAAGQVIALVISPQNGDHSCDLTAVNLTIRQGESQWDLAKEVAPNILAGNPQGPWHFLSQPASPNPPHQLPQAMLDWLRNPSPILAAKVRQQLEQEFPFGHPLLKASFRSFQSQQQSNDLTAVVPSALAVHIPAELARGGELMVTARLAGPDGGSIQSWIRTASPVKPITDAQPDAPFIVGDNSSAKRRLEAAFDEFRELFPVALCYERIVPVDEVVTLTLYHREDHHLQNLILNESEIQELDRLWEELFFVSDAPLKQVDAFEQIYQFATQDRPDLVNDFESLREPIQKAAEGFKTRRQAADPAQRQAVTEFAARAWRRPLTEPEIAGLMKLPPRLMLVRILTSPAFLYRAEKVPQQTGPVNDWELATRLSYFLWSSVPDHELRTLAAAKQLGDPEVLVRQARRMLQDEKVRRLATEFGCQWLQVRDLATLDEKSERHFPSFVELRADMQEEVTRFFIDLFQNNGDVLSLLNADHTFINGKLAAHYGLEFSGEDWQRVEGLRNYGRGGILGFSATLAKNSGASRSSAILRGTWLSEVVLGEKLPNPPPGVPVLPVETPTGLTDRQLIEMHSSDVRCAGCHKRVDPLGFALENFDAIGRLREADTRTTLFDGTRVDGLDDLRTYLTSQRRDDFVQQFSRKLLGYALGRSVQLSDQPLLDSMANTQGCRVGSVVESIVRSPQFREIRGAENVEKILQREEK